MGEEVESAYVQNVNDLTIRLQKLQQKRTRLGWLRLIIILIAIGIAASLLPAYLLQGWLVIIAGLALFLFTVSADVKNNRQIAHCERLLSINKEELAILAHQFSHREDGQQFLPREHAYAADLDLFGPASLYQYINRCTAAQSKNLLAQRLLNPLPAEAIERWQEAVKEFAPQLSWRQELQALGIANPLGLLTEQKINSWLSSASPYQSPIWKMLIWIFPVITLGTTAAYMLDYLPAPVFSAMVTVFFLIGLSISRKISPTYAALSKIVDEISTLQQQLKHFEQLQVRAGLLSALQSKLSEHGKASSSIDALKKILNRFDYRLNILVFFVLNSFLLWDLRQLLSLQKWRKVHAPDIASWFSVIADLEVINSLAALSYNHPSWVFPQLSNVHFTLQALQVGHPLIPVNNCVTNSFSAEGKGKVSIITGSNMAGKSTFLRSIGVNMVLAQMGAPVFASSFCCSPVHVYSSMRIADNLAENTSTFYAELKKLKTIIEQVNQHQKVFVLLDEILRGTNSLDRHTGSKALIKQLIREQAVAIIATHDVALAELERSYITSVKNYHFDVQVEGEELYFDYKLKQGICQSMNASILMKKIGIEL